jgi:ABC-2 type transport system ATP-binding protein
VPMISVRNLLKQYDGKTALNHLSLEVGQGVIFGLLGPNGAGKTTLVSILNGLTDFQEGAVEVLGLPLRENLRTIRKQCSLIPQSLAFYDNLSVLENLRFFAGIQNIKAARLKKNIDYAIGVNRLERMLEQKAATLSGGQKRRLNIAIGLLNDPQILYFDEPTVGIDPESRNEILETIKSFKDEKKTVIYTSHYMPEIEKICDEVAIINRGEIVKKGTLQNMLHEEDVSSAVIEIYETPLPKLDAIASELENLRVIDASTLMLEQQTNETMAFLLNLLEKAEVRVKQIRFGTTNLESLFIRLTSQGGGDA